MKGSLFPLFFVCFAATCMEPVYSIFTVPRPMGCTQARSTLGVGCHLGKCISGWCSKNGGRNVWMMCLPSCPAGEYCYRGLTNMCTVCGVSNCERCTEWYTCDACKTGYTFSSDKRQCTGSFG